MSNSKEFQLSGGGLGFAHVSADPATGDILRAYDPLEVSAGRVLGLTPFTMRGSRLALAADTESVVQEIATVLVASSAGVAISAQSSSASDVGVVLTVEALGADYALLPAFDVVLNGTTPVVLPGGPFTRINAINRKAGDLVGNVTFTNAGNTHAAIAAGQQVMRSAIYTVPAGHRGYLFDTFGALAKDTGANTVVRYSLQLKPVGSLGFGALIEWTGARDGSCSPQISQKFSRPIAGPFDIRMTAKASTVGTDVQAFLSGVVHKLNP